MKITFDVNGDTIRRALRLGARALLVAALAWPTYLAAGQVAPFVRFEPGKTIRASDFNANFDAIRMTLVEHDARIGDLSDLRTTNHASIVAAINGLASAGTAGPQGPAGPQGSIGPQGPAGPAGPQGAAAISRVWGDGSAGAFDATANATLADTNLQYGNFTVEPGVTLTIESGAVIRCTGTFTCAGTIVVTTGARGGTDAIGNGTGGGLATLSPANLGVSARAAGEGGSTTSANSTSVYAPGAGGVALSTFQARQLRLVGPWAGGGGGGTQAGAGGAGGGSLVVLARGGVVVSGAIQANGESPSSAGAGGGAGGVVILASAGSIQQTGSICARGGAGSNGTSTVGAGGGGGGGFVHLLAPSIAATGGANVAAGSSGASGGVLNLGNPQGGGGGGACAGSGGSGAWGNSSFVNAAASGQNGIALQSLLDPTGVF